MHPAFLALFILAVLLYLLIALIRRLPPLRKRLHILFLGVPGGLFAVLTVMAVAGPSIKNEHFASDSATASSDKPVEADAPGTKEAATEDLDFFITPTSPLDAPVDEKKGFAVAALTHHNKGVGKRVTYRDPRTVRIERSQFSDDDWTIKADHADVICFADGGNAVFLTMDGTIVAANGTARQFVDHADGDGILLEDGTLQPVLKPDREKHGNLLSKVIDIGLKTCGRKNLDEISRAVRNAAGETDAEQKHRTIYIEASLAMVGAKICGYELDPVALVDYLQANGIEQAAFKAHIGHYLSLAEGVLASGDESLCRDQVLPKYGQGGVGFISE